MFHGKWFLPILAKITTNLKLGKTNVLKQSVKGVR